MEEIHVTLVYESAEISSFLMILNSRLSVVFIKLFILINEKIIIFFFRAFMHLQREVYQLMDGTRPPINLGSGALVLLSVPLDKNNEGNDS